jgi:hypothetical protein
MSLALILAVLLAQDPAGAAAQSQGASPQPPPVVAKAVPPPTCRKPPLVKRQGITQEDIANTGEQAQAFVDCMKGYIEAEVKAANGLMAEAKGHAAANNQAVTDVNAFIAAHREWAAEIRAGGN